jgi:protein involved in polysaccharide export with SLBB domain
MIHQIRQLRQSGRILSMAALFVLAVSIASAQAPPNPTADTTSPPSPLPTTSPTPGRSNENNPVNPARKETASEEESAILPYYNNYLREYRLGPEDVISVEVFGQPTYSKAAIVIPPTAKISYPLVPGGIFVGGKTVDEVAEDIKKKLDEYIIEPQVTVTLDKVGSARYSVLGKVVTPGVKVMNRRFSLYEAIADAGGIDKEGDKSRILLIRLAPNGGITQTVFNMNDLMKGKGEVPYLIPGDQIVVPEKRWSLTRITAIVGKASMLAVLFGSAF